MVWFNRTQCRDLPSHVGVIPRPNCYASHVRSTTAATASKMVSNSGIIWCLELWQACSCQLLGLVDWLVNGSAVAWDCYKPWMGNPLKATSRSNPQDVVILAYCCSTKLISITCLIIVPCHLPAWAIVSDHNQLTLQPYLTVANKHY